MKIKRCGRPSQGNLARWRDLEAGSDAQDKIGVAGGVKETLHGPWEGLVSKGLQEGRSATGSRRGTAEQRVPMFPCCIRVLLTWMVSAICLPHFLHKLRVRWSWTPGGSGGPQIPGAAAVLSTDEMPNPSQSSCKESVHPKGTAFQRQEGESKKPCESCAGPGSRSSRSRRCPCPEITFHVKWEDQRIHPPTW